MTIETGDIHGDYTALRSRWVATHLGYTLQSRTSYGWDRYNRTEAGQRHKANLDALSKEFDEAVWPVVLAAIPKASGVGPFEEPK